MHKDAQDNPLSGTTSEAADLFNAAVRAFNIYDGDPVDMVDRAIVMAPDFTMAHLLRAYLFVLATEPEAAREAEKSLNRVRQLQHSEREASHISILGHVLQGDWNKAAMAMDRHNMEFPRDLVGLQSGHLMDFYRGNRRDLRDRIARALPFWSPDIPGYPIVLGMYAFGLEECEDYSKAEDMGRQAIDLEPLDCWAHHAVTHVMEMQGRAQDGVGWMVSREPHWSQSGNFFKVHNWWHRALFHFDLGQISEVFQIYDRSIRGDRSIVALDLIDASALLWRLSISGFNVGERWKEISQSWDLHADGKLYPFNDWHAVMAYLGAGDTNKVDSIKKSLQETAGEDNEIARSARNIALPLIRGFEAFWEGRYTDAVEYLHRTRYIANQFGGSNAQRDVIDWTLTEAALQSGMTMVATGLANERIALKPYSPLNRQFLERVDKLRSKDTLPNKDSQESLAMASTPTRLY